MASKSTKVGQSAITSVLTDRMILAMDFWYLIVVYGIGRYISIGFPHFLLCSSSWNFMQIGLNQCDLNWIVDSCMLFEKFKIMRNVYRSMFCNYSNYQKSILPSLTLSFYRSKRIKKKCTSQYKLCITSILFA